jgi:hypothetical protein
MKSVHQLASALIRKIARRLRLQTYQSAIVDELVNLSNEAGAISHRHPLI